MFILVFFYFKSLRVRSSNLFKNMNKQISKNTLINYYWDPAQPKLALLWQCPGNRYQIPITQIPGDIVGAYTL